ncbi:MAG: Do family serine endopeptidase [bacterium]
MIKKVLKNGWFWFVIVISVIFYNLCEKQNGLLENKKALSKEAVLCSTSLEVPANVNKLQESFRQVAELAKPAVVSITTIHVESFEYAPFYEFFFGDPFEDFFGSPGQKPNTAPKKYERKFEGMGSGVIIDAKGLILTNEHVVRDADQIKIHIADREKPLTGEIVGKDARTDLAVVKIKEKGNYSSLNLADSAEIKVGDWAIAIGSPFGLEQTLTVGVISAVRQSLSIEGQQYRDLIQTDAAINRGNSGGPLLNIKGEVIGINTAIYAPTGVFAGIGFAIPINRAKSILEDLIHKGKVVRGWLGVEIKKVDEVIAEQFGLKEAEGALVNDVFGGSPADEAGLIRGDIIMEFDGKKIKDVTNLQDVVASTPPKKRVEIKILRQKKVKTINLVTGEVPSTTDIVQEKSEKSEVLSKEWLGIKTQNIDAMLAKKYRLGLDEKGVVVTEIDMAKEAAQAGIREGDLIKSINQNKTMNIEMFNDVVSKIKKSGGIVFDVVREGKPLYISFLME